MQSGILQDSNRSLLDEIIYGLERPEKYIPSKLFYDERGSQLFDQICELDEYYLTRTELSIIHNNVKEIARLGGDVSSMVPGPVLTRLHAKLGASD